MSTLADHFLRFYGGFADKRIKASSSDRAIKIDDRTEFDRSPVFCSMFVRVTGPTQLELSITNLPLDEHVRKSLTSLRAKIAEMDYGNQVEIPITLKSAKRLRRLATQVRRIVGRGRRYADPNWKWICPRTARSLNRLATFLDQLPMDCRCPTS